MSRYYPGFLAAFFIVLLRVAIGWHFLYEGWEKLESTYGEGKEPFSAEIYLRNANGPFAPYFRAMIPDADGLERLDPDHLKAEWTAEVSRITGHFHFDAEQQQKAQAVLDENLKWATYWFDDPPNAEKLKKYQHEVQKIKLTDADPLAMSYQKERAQDARRALEGDRRSLLAPFNDQQKILRDSVIKLATPDQLNSAGAPSVPRLQSGRDQPGHDVRPDRDRRVPDPRFLDPAGRPGGGRVSGDDLFLDASLAGFAAQPEG